jgi:uncharacterized protein (UPF0332 family)
MVSEIEEDYQAIIREFEKYVVPRKYDPYGYHERIDYGFKEEISEQDLLSLIRHTNSFQRKIELTRDMAQRLLAKTNHPQRIVTIGNNVIDRLCNEKNSYETITYYCHVKYVVKGVIPLLKEAHKQFLEDENSEYSRRTCYSSYRGFKLVNSQLIEFQEELRLISALTTYPIGKRTLLKNQLVINNFEEAAVSLEEAESNLESEHFKDSVSRCRDAIEIFIASIRKNETGEETEKHFSTDLGKIAKIGVFDEATQKLTQGVYSFLSLKGSHKYDDNKVEIYDAETSLKETYSLIEMLLNKLANYQKSKEKKLSTKSL